MQILSYVITLGVSALITYFFLSSIDNQYFQAHNLNELFQLVAIYDNNNEAEQKVAEIENSSKDVYIHTDDSVSQPLVVDPSMKQKEEIANAVLRYGRKAPYESLLSRLSPYIRRPEMWDHLNVSDLEDPKIIRDNVEELDFIDINKDVAKVLNSKLEERSLYGDWFANDENREVNAAPFINRYFSNFKKSHIYDYRQRRIIKSMSLDVQRDLTPYFLKKIPCFQTIYHPYNPVQYYHNGTTIKYYYQTPYEYPEPNNNHKEAFSSVVDIYPVGLRFTFFSLPNYKELNDLFDPYKIVIFIKNNVYNYERRNNIRNAYKNNTVFNEFPFKLYFLVGMNDDKELQENIYKEQKEKNDLIVMNILDTYGNNTLKVMMIEDLIVYSKTTVDFIGIMDDDTCFNMKKISELLKGMEPGWFMTGIRRIAYSDNVLYSKHATPQYCIPSPTPFFDGPFIIMSKNVVRRHVHVFPYLQCIVHTDDVFLGYLSLLANIPLYAKNLPKGNDYSIAQKVDHIAESKYFYVHKVTNYHFTTYCVQ
ncbi:hypothetical protein WA158_005945 [Blastocystis sp. Blastoise]